MYRGTNSRPPCCLAYVGSSKTNLATFYFRAQGCVFQNRVIWPRNARKKLRMGDGQERKPRNEMQPLTRRGAVATPSEERRGAQPTRMRCDAAAPRCPRHAWTDRCRSGTNAAHKHPRPVVEGSVLMVFRPQAPRSTCCGRVYSALALMKTAVLVWQHVSTPMLAAAVLPTYTNNTSYTSYPAGTKHSVCSRSSRQSCDYSTYFGDVCGISLCSN